MKSTLIITILFCVLFAFMVQEVSGQSSQRKIKREFKREIKLNNRDFREVEKSILQDFADLEDCLITICDRETTFDYAVETINYAIKHVFVGESSRVAVSNVNRTQVKIHKVRQYLNNLMSLPYSDIEFEWIDIDFIEALRRGPDGKYYGLITITQKFKGYMGDGLVYKDTTVKHAEIEVELYYDPVTGDPGYDVRIKDIGVITTETK